MEYIDEWDEILDIAMFSYRISTAEKSKKSPFELLYGRSPFINQTENHVNKQEKKETNMESKRKMLGKIIMERNQKYAEQINRINKNSKRSVNDDLEAVDVVLYTNRQKESKFSDKWIGPFIVVNVK